MSDDLSVHAQQASFSPDSSRPARAPLAQPARGLDVDDEMTVIVTRLYPRLLAWAHSLVGVEDGEDVVQEAMLRFWRREMRLPVSAEHLTPSTVLMQLIHDIARERARHATRRASIVQRLRGPVTRYMATHVSSPFISGVRLWMSPGGDHERQEIDPAITAAIDALPPRQRDAFILVAGHDLTYEDAAVVLQQGTSTVRANYARANAKLRTALRALMGVRTRRRLEEDAKSRTRTSPPKAIAAAGATHREDA